MAGGQAVVITARYVVFLRQAAVGPDDHGTPFGNRGGSARIENPRGADVDSFVELVVQAKVNAMSAVVFIGKRFTVVDGPVFKLPVALGQCVR